MQTSSRRGFEEEGESPRVLQYLASLLISSSSGVCTTLERAPSLACHGMLQQQHSLGMVLNSSSLMPAEAESTQSERHIATSSCCRWHGGMAPSAVVGLCSNWIGENEAIVHEGRLSKGVVIPVLKGKLHV